MDVGRDFEAIVEDVLSEYSVVLSEKEENLSHPDVLTSMRSASQNGMGFYFISRLTGEYFRHDFDVEVTFRSGYSANFVASVDSLDWEPRFRIHYLFSDTFVPHHDGVPEDPEYFNILKAYEDMDKLISCYGETDDALAQMNALQTGRLEIIKGMRESIRERFPIYRFHCCLYEQSRDDFVVELKSYLSQQSRILQL